MFERFSSRVKRILDLAKEEAIRFGHSYIGTEHLLLGLLEEGILSGKSQGIATATLELMGYDLERIKIEAERVMHSGFPLLTVGDLPLDSEAKRVLELAVEEAKSYGHSYIGSEHLLLGIIRGERGLTYQVLERLGITEQKVREMIYEILGGRPRKRASDKKQKTPALDTFGRDLTLLAAEKKLDPVVGREEEIERLIQILCRRKKNNPVLIGEAGVGKTAIIEGFAQKVAASSIPELLQGKRVMMLDLGALVAGTKYRGEFERRIKIIMNEIASSRNIILFIDELHTLVGAGAAEGALDASNILKPALSSGEIQFIGATTLGEYRKYIENDSALERRFQTIFVEPPTVSQTIEILKGLRSRYEEYHQVKISNQAIDASAKLSDRYISGRFLPDKAIDLIDESASQLRIRLSILPDGLKKMLKEIEEIEKKKEIATNLQDFERAAFLRDSQERLKAEFEDEKKRWKEKRKKKIGVIGEEEVSQIVAQWTGIPVSRLQREEKGRLLKMEEKIHQRVVGQEEAVNALCRAIRRQRVGLKDKNRPIGSFIFLGPTGVGKTLLAKSIAESLFGEESALIQIDMSEYMEKFSVSRLIGAPPGYVGYEEGGQLTEAVRRRPYSVILFDEIEKAHPDVFNILLQILEEGKLTDSFGRHVNFQNTILVMTSNIGGKLWKGGGVLGFGKEDADSSYEGIKERLLDETKKVFQPEFLNRIDETIIFKPLSRDEISRIVDLEVRKVAFRLEEEKIMIKLNKKANSFLMEKGYDPNLGARPLKRAISRYLEDPLSEEVLSGNFRPGIRIRVKANKDGLVFEEITSNRPITVQ